MTSFIRLQEFQWRPVPSDHLVRNGRLDVDEGVARKDYFELRFTTEKSEIQARGWIGLIPLNDRLTLEVSPRVTVSNLTRLMEVSKAAPVLLRNTLRAYERAGKLYPSLLSLYTDALHRAVLGLSTTGLLKEYERKETSSSMPHGRILVGPSIQRSLSRGRSHEVTIGWSQRTTDNPANRCLLYAVHRLRSYALRFGTELLDGDRRKIFRRLNHCGQLLEGVHLDLDQAFLSDPLVVGARNLPALHSAYRGALDVALTIIGGQAISFEAAGHAVRLPSLLIDMGAVFESYLRNVLRQGASQEVWPVAVLDGNQEPGRKHLLDDGLIIDATPDIVLASGPHGTGPYPAILEVKYKPAKRRPQRGDLDQTLAYGISYRAQHIVVVQPRHPKGVGPGLHELGTLAGMKVWMYVFDMGADDLRIEEAAFVRDVGPLAGMPEG